MNTKMCDICIHKIIFTLFGRSRKWLDFKTLLCSWSETLAYIFLQALKFSVVGQTHYLKKKLIKLNTYTGTLESMIRYCYLMLSPYFGISPLCKLLLAWFLWQRCDSLDGKIIFCVNLSLLWSEYPRRLKASLLDLKLAVQTCV